MYRNVRSRNAAAELPEDLAVEVAKRLNPQSRATLAPDVGGNIAPYDTLIKNGEVIDGSGARRYKADVAAVDGKIEAEIGNLGGTATRVIDATGRVVSPGFIDPHTHRDAQICWDRAVSPSGWHGITTVIMGNCGVGIAPLPARYARDRHAGPSEHRSDGL